MSNYPDIAVRQQAQPLTNLKRYVFTYQVLAGTTPLQLVVYIEPLPSSTSPGTYIFRLSLRVNGLERQLCEPTVRKLRFDPQQLEFAVYLYPGKSSLPSDCLWSFRVWLRSNGTDHRLFGEDELWVGKDPDFSSINDASFARLKRIDTNEQWYNAFLGKALVSFIVKWTEIERGDYRYSLEYESGGVGHLLFENFRIKTERNPAAITFLIYSVPIASVPSGASHRLRVWVRSPAAETGPSSVDRVPLSGSHVYQRVWKTDSFKIGGSLDFVSLGSKLIMGVAVGAPETVPMSENETHNTKTEASKNSEVAPAKSNGETSKKTKTLKDPPEPGTSDILPNSIYRGFLR